MSAGHLMLSLSEPGTAERQIIDGAVRHCARFGVAKTTVADIAREAGVSRATVYRVFPSGRDGILEAVRRHRVLSFFAALDAELAACADLAEIIGCCLHTAASTLAADDEFQAMLAHEPGPLLETLSGRGLQRIFAAARIFVAPHAEPFVGSPEAERLSEWMTRIVLSYTLDPSPFLDLTQRPQVDHFVTSFVLPGLGPVQGAVSPSPTLQEAGS